MVTGCDYVMIRNRLLTSYELDCEPCPFFMQRGATAVFFASFYGHKQAVGRLMKLGADLDIPNAVKLYSNIHL